MIVTTTYEDISNTIMKYPEAEDALKLLFPSAFNIAITGKHEFTQRVHGKFKQKGFYLPSQFQGRNVTWRVEKDNEGIDVLVPSLRN